MCAVFIQGLHNACMRAHEHAHFDGLAGLDVVGMTFTPYIRIRCEHNIRLRLYDPFCQSKSRILCTVLSAVRKKEKCDILNAEQCCRGT